MAIGDKKSFTIAMKDFFGYRVTTGVTMGLKDFQEELKALTFEDKMYFFEGLKGQGIDCLEPSK